jgi:RNA polymerase sigma-70 factor (ECF subfamily)
LLHGVHICFQQWPNLPSGKLSIVLLLIDRPWPGKLRFSSCHAVRAFGGISGGVNPEYPRGAYLLKWSIHRLVSPETGAELRATDAALMDKIVARDEAALAALYDRYAAMLSSVLNRILRDSQAAEEILQDTFFQLWRSAARFDATRGSLAGWLLVIARHRAISRLRRRNPAAGEELSENSVVLPLNLESTVSQQQLLGRVKSALENLPAEQRACVELAYFEGLTHTEIAERTGDPLGTVKTRLRSAVESLKRNLQ